MSTNLIPPVAGEVRSVAGKKGDVILYKSDIVDLNLQGEVDASHTHFQDIADSVWIVQHNLGKRPVVAVMDSAGTNIVGRVEYDLTDINKVIIRFAFPFAGKAVCS